MRELDIDGGLHVYDRGSGPIVVMWHAGSPNIGHPPVPLFAAADRLGVRFIGYDRPGYGGSAPRPGRTVGSAAADAAAVADALGVDRFAVLGPSGGGPHSLACAALLGDRVTAAANLSGLAPFDAEGLDWFAGMGPNGSAGLRAAAEGRAAKEEFESVPHDPDFLPADWAALEGEWGWLGSVVRPAVENGMGPLIDDDLAYVSPWGFDVTSIKTPVLFAHGTGDRVVPSTHSEWLAAHITGAELRLVPGEGHVSVLPIAAEPALEWLAAAASR